MLQKVKENPIKTAIGVVSLIGSLFTAVFVFEDRYANKETVNDKINKQEQQIVFLKSNLQQTSNKILDFLKKQAITRKAVLEMKEASGKLTPEETVELINLKETLETI